MNELANHLLQSTLFATAIALTTVTLRRNRARVRYWLWLSASIKFLIPFSLLVSIGQQVEMPGVVPPLPSGTVEQISMYFAPVQELTTQESVATTPRWPAVLTVIWFGRSVLLVLRWFRRWRMIHRAARNAKPVSLHYAVPILSSPVLMEPGVFGVFRPLLLLPEGITTNLRPAELDAILAHELCHVRHRDNLTAAVHMCVETLFWFHPLVWWIGARLIAERERDCDESVLRQGSRPHDYVQGILTVCKSYAECPLSCTAGVTGAELKTRIREIITHRHSIPMTPLRKAILMTAGLTAVAVPAIIGVLQAQPLPPTRFEVASVKPSPPDDGRPRGVNESTGGPGTSNPGLYRATNMSISGLLMQAYNVKPYQVSAPAWLNTTYFEVNAKVPAGATRDQFRLMLQNFLAERFQMVTHQETKESQVFELVQAKGGHKMKEYVEDPASPAKGGVTSVRTKKAGGPAPGNMVLSTGGTSGTHVDSTGMPVEGLLRTLSNYLRKPVINATGLTGRYNIKFDFSPEGLPGRPVQVRAPQGTPDASLDRAPDLFTAVQEQLGLKLEQKRGTIEVIVVDKALKTPTAN